MKPTPLRSWLAVAAVALCAFAQNTLAEPGFPNKPVKFLVGFGAGSGTDILARIVADEMAAELKPPFIVENRPGASAQLAAAAATQAAPDGYTLFFSPSSPMVVNPPPA